MKCIKNITTLYYHYDTHEERGAHVGLMLSQGWSNDGQISQNIGSITEPKYVPYACFMRYVDKAKWNPIYYEGGIFDGDTFDKCSNCGYERLIKDYSYKTRYKHCPECGYEMEG